MPPFSYTYSYNAYDNYKYALMKLICCYYGLTYLQNYGDRIVLYIIGVMESNYGKNVEDWEILDQIDLADYIKEMNIHA
jgi:hypothetical protein